MTSVQCFDCGKFFEPGQVVLAERVTATGSNGVEVRSRTNVCLNCNNSHNTSTLLRNLTVFPATALGGLVGWLVYSAGVGQRKDLFLFVGGGAVLGQLLGWGAYLILSGKAKA